MTVHCVACTRLQVNVLDYAPSSTTSVFSDASYTMPISVDNVEDAPTVVVSGKGVLAPHECTFLSGSSPVKVVDPVVANPVFSPEIKVRTVEISMRIRNKARGADLSPDEHLIFTSPSTPVIEVVRKHSNTTSVSDRRYVIKSTGFELPSKELNELVSSFRYVHTSLSIDPFTEELSDSRDRLVIFTVNNNDEARSETTIKLGQGESRPVVNLDTEVEGFDTYVADALSTKEASVPLFPNLAIEGDGLVRAVVRIEAATLEDRLQVAMPATMTQQGWSNRFINGELRIASTSTDGAAWAKLLQTVTYSGTVPKRVHVIVSTAAADSLPVTAHIQAPDTFSPMLDLNGDGTGNAITDRGYVVEYIQGSGPVTLLTGGSGRQGLTLIDPDSKILKQAIVRITNAQDCPDEALSVSVNLARIGLTATPGGYGTITISGSQSVSNYVKALNGVGYQNKASKPTTGKRLIEFVVTDAKEHTSRPVSVIVAVRITNDRPKMYVADDVQRFEVPQDIQDAENNGISVADLVNAEPTPMFTPDKMFFATCEVDTVKGCTFANAKAKCYNNAMQLCTQRQVHDTWRAEKHVPKDGVLFWTADEITKDPHAGFDLVANAKLEDIVITGGPKPDNHSAYALHTFVGAEKPRFLVARQKSFDLGGKEFGAVCCEPSPGAGKRAQAVFNMEGVAGTLNLWQASPQHATVVSLNFNGLEKRATAFTLNPLPVTDKPTAPIFGYSRESCAGPKTGARDLLFAKGALFGGLDEFDQNIQRNEITGKKSVSISFPDASLSLFGRESAIGYSMVIFDSRGEWLCATVQQLGQSLKTMEATFFSDLFTGSLTLQQPQDDPSAETSLFFNVEIDPAEKESVGLDFFWAVVNTGGKDCFASSDELKQKVVRPLRFDGAANAYRKVFAVDGLPLSGPNSIEDLQLIFMKKRDTFNKLTDHCAAMTLRIPRKVAKAQIKSTGDHDGVTFNFVQENQYTALKASAQYSALNTDVAVHAYPKLDGDPTACGVDVLGPVLYKLAASQSPAPVTGDEVLYQASKS